MSPSPERTLAVLGLGNMAGAIVEALLADGWTAQDIRGTTLDEAGAATWRERGLTMTDNVSAVDGADIVLVSTKPADAVSVLREVAPYLGERTLVVSIAAGVTLASLEGAVPGGTRIVRVMPNTPALVGVGMAAMSPGSACDDEDVERARSLLAATGKVVVVPERQQDAVTAVSGSGPAYVFYVAEAMIEAGVGLGLARPLATELAVQTLLGAATMLDRGETHPSLLREQVTSPGGSTYVALRELDAHAVRAAFAAAMRSCAQRSAELGG